MYVLASTSGPCIFFLPQGGLDNYLVNTRPDKLDSELGMMLKDQVGLVRLPGPSCELACFPPTSSCREQLRCANGAMTSPLLRLQVIEQRRRRAAGEDLLPPPPMADTAGRKASA